MRTFLLSLLFLCSFLVKAEINPQAPSETQQFAPLLGHWQITDYQLAEDGSWQEGQGADWHWYTILDGYAIQDDWVAPSLDSAIANIDRQFGTNIRIYNPKKQQWEMAWMSKQGQQLDTFTALADDNSIVMQGYFAGNDSRITFFNLQPDSFQWKLEFKTENGWQEVYRITGARKK